MDTPTVLSEKLRRPEPSGLPRPRLERPLRDGPTAGLDLVVAPPGSGKTTLLARVAGESGVPTAWYRVTSEDGSEAALVAHLARALQDSIGIAPTSYTMSALLSALEVWDGSTASVILDDLHEIAGTPAERALEHFVMLRPPRLRVVFGSRRHPGLNIPRLRVSGALHEVTSDDLRFRSWEVEDLFFGVFGRPLPPESAAALTRRTGGWAAGLQLFHLATAQLGPLQRRQAVADLGGRSKLIRSYLARNVLAELPEEHRLFLLRTCTLGPLTGPLCDALLGTTGSAHLLAELEHRQLFTSSADDGRTFRYHEVLRNHLELALVEEYGAAGARNWYAKAATLLESAGQISAAARAYGRAEDWESVARLIKLDGENIGGSVVNAELLFPPALLEHDPWLTLADARRRVRNGSLGTAAASFRRAQQLLDEPSFHVRCQLESSALTPWLPDPGKGRPPSGPGGELVLPQHWSAQLRQSTRHGGAAAQPGHSAGGRLAAGTAALLAGDLRSAVPLLQSVQDDADSGGTLTLLAQLALTVTELLSGRAPDPSGLLAELVTEAEASALPWVARLARGLHAAVTVTASGPNRGGSGCADVLVECERAEDPWGAALVQLAAGIAAKASPATAQPLLLDAAARFGALDAPVLQCWAEALVARHDPGSIAAVRRTVNRARVLELPGVEAVALSALAAVDHKPETRRTAVAAATACGISRTSVIGPAWDRAVVPATPTMDSVPAGPNEVEVRCFGGFAVLVNGRAIALDGLRPRARALLRMLATSPDRDIHRERLIDALWPGADLVTGTRRLQVSVSSVRQLLEHSGLSGADLLPRHGDAYRFSPPPGARVDIRDFEQLLRESTTRSSHGDLEGAVQSRGRALELYVGELLPEDGPAEHVVAERERLRLVAAAAAADQAQDCRTLGNTRAALAAARTSVHIDPYQDLPWQLLVELYEAAGDSSAADRARRERIRAQADLDLSPAELDLSPAG